MSTPTPPIILPKTGFAKVQSVLSGDTVVLLGKPTRPNQPPPQVLFTLSSVSAPVRMRERESLTLQFALKDPTQLNIQIFTHTASRE